jgi:hypothetical protein
MTNAPDRVPGAVTVAPALEECGPESGAALHRRVLAFPTVYSSHPEIARSVPRAGINFEGFEYGIP